MTIKRIQKALEDALLFGGPMSQELYHFELEEIKDDLLTSLRQDNDAFIFAVTENKKAVAMILIEPSEDIYINEQARVRLQELWPLVLQRRVIYSSHAEVTRSRRCRPPWCQS